jgi:hypothetical protein
MDTEARFWPRILRWLFYLLLVAGSLDRQFTFAQPAKTGLKKATIRGKVVDEDGKPVAGATVAGLSVSFKSMGRVQAILPGAITDQVTNDKGEFAAEVDVPGDGLKLTLRARFKDAFMAKPLRLSGDQLTKPVTLRISAKNARSLRVRVVDEDGKPVAGAKITARQQPTFPDSLPGFGTKDVDIPRSANATDAQGKLETPRCTEPDGNYQLRVAAEGYLEETTASKSIGDDPVLVFDDVILLRVRPLEGEVRDSQGKAVSGAHLVYADSRQRVEATTDDAGRFTLKSAFTPPGFLFVEQPGFRFHGQRCDKPDAPTITLLRRDEPEEKPMAALPPALPRDERKALAMRLLEPMLQALLEKGSDDARLRPLQTLAKVDPGRLLEELEKRPYASAWYDGYLRRDAVKPLLPNSFDEARSIVDSMRDPGFRCMGYLDLCDYLPDSKRAEKIALLDQALLHSRGIVENDHRVIDVGWIARRYWALGEKDRATKLLREGQAIAKELPTAAWAGYARGAFAEDLGLIDLPAALELMKDLKDPFEYGRHHGNLAFKLSASRPEEAQRILDKLAQSKDRQANSQAQQYAGLVSYRIAAKNLPLARKIAEIIQLPPDRARAYGLMAKALTKNNPKEALALLDQAFDILSAHVASGANQFNNFYDTAVIAGLLIPIAEQIDPSRTRECFWRALSFRFGPMKKRDGPTTYAGSDALGILAHVLARYDRAIAMALVEQAERTRDGQQFACNTHFMAAAVADPRRAVELLEKLPKGENSDYTRQSVIGWLIKEGDDIGRGLLSAAGMGDPDEEDR